MTKGFYVAFEGGEGAGKGTQVDLLKERIYQEGLGEDSPFIVMVREPGSTAFGEHIRSVLFGEQHHELFAEKNLEMHLRTEALLFAAQRAELIEQVVKPSLATGCIVISDRTYFSSLAYQCFGRLEGEYLKFLEKMNLWAIGGCIPDKTYLLETTVETGLARKQADEINRFEQEAIDFHTRVAAGFTELALMYPFNFLKIDAETQDAQAVHEEIWEDFKREYHQRNGR